MRYLPGTPAVSDLVDRWEVRDPHGMLVCVTVYKCGAAEVVHRLAAWSRARNGSRSASAAAAVPHLQRLSGLVPARRRG